MSKTSQEPRNHHSESVESHPHTIQRSLVASTQWLDQGTDISHLWKRKIIRTQLRLKRICWLIGGQNHTIYGNVSSPRTHPDHFAALGLGQVMFAYSVRLNQIKRPIARKYHQIRITLFFSMPLSSLFLAGGLVKVPCVSCFVYSRLLFI